MKLTFDRFDGSLLESKICGMLDKMLQKNLICGLHEWARVLKSIIDPKATKNCLDSRVGLPRTGIGVVFN